MKLKTHPPTRRHLLHAIPAVLAMTATATLALCGTARLSAAEKSEPAPKASPEHPVAIPLQVEIEAKFVEMPESGGDWPALPDGEEARGGLVGGFTAEQAKTFWKKVNATKGADLLSAPRVTTKSKQHAIIEVIREFRYATEWEQDAKPGTWKATAFETKDVGVTLDVEPVVGDDGSIDLTLAPKVVEFQGFTDTDAGEVVIKAKHDPSKRGLRRIFDKLKMAAPEGHRAQPIFSTRKLSVAVTVQPGATIVMELGKAGDGKVAGIPKSNGKKKGEPPNAERRVLVFVTANIIKPVVAEKSATITSDSIHYDKVTGNVTARGNVVIETPQAVITTDKAEIKARQPAK